MKLKKVLSICKTNGLYYLYDRIDRSGEITQWLGDASALYPLDGLPILDEESFCAVFDITGKQREKILFRHERLPEHLNAEDVAAGDKLVREYETTFINGGLRLKPLKTNNGVMFIRSLYLSPLEDVIDMVQFYERTTPQGGSYIVAKAGFLTAAVIMPYVISKKFADELEELSYERMRESVETYSTAGPLGGYEYFAKSASALIADVKATSPKPGEVDVRVLLTGGELPGEEILKEVLDILNADTVRPLTDHVTVAAPQAVPYNIDVTYYTQEGGALSADTIAADVAAAVKSFQKWQAEKMGRDVNPSQLIALLMQTGVKRVEVRSPVFAAVADNAVAQVGTVSVVNGGAERE